MPYHDWGGCPFECCVYREWVAQAAVTLYSRRDERSAAVFRVEQGERALAMTGVVVTHKFGVSEVLRPVRIGYPPKGRKPVLALQPGDVVYTLHYAGEGNDLFWYRGKVYVDQVALPDSAFGVDPDGAALKVLSRPEYVWWARIRNAAGKSGWTRETDKFGNKDACG